jgi:hypothetical protein
MKTRAILRLRNSPSGKPNEQEERASTFSKRVLAYREALI